MRQVWHGLVVGFATMGVVVMPAAGDVRISQVYGAGGNSGAVINADFVELHNSSSAPLDIGGWTLTYASTTGTFGSLQATLPSGTIIAAKGYLLVRMGSRGTVGTDIEADAAGSTVVDMAATAGNIALLTAAQSGTTNTCASLNATLVDKVGYGSGANCAEGGVAAAPSTTLTTRRRDDGGQDTDSNAVDFYAGVPLFRTARTRFSAIADLGSSPSGDGWTVSSTGSVASSVTTTSTSNVAIGNPAWSMNANGTSNTSISATRTFSAAAVPGETIGLLLEHGSVNAGASLKVEFLSGSSTVLTFQYVGGQSGYQVIDSSGTTTLNASTTNDALRLSVALRQGSSYTLDLDAAGTPAARSGALVGGAASVTGVRISAANMGSGNTVYFNDLRVEQSQAAATLSSWSIPNNSTTGQSKSFTIATADVPVGARVSGVSVVLTELVNGNVGDVVAELQAPDGTIATILDRVGATGASGTGDNSNLNGTYGFIDGSARSLWATADTGGNSTNLAAADYFPSAALTGNRANLMTSFADRFAAGTWTLTIRDRGNNNDTTLTSATVRITVRPDPDTDGDGTTDSQDGCPNDPNKIAAGACGCGVADTDTDNDGTADCVDGCPSNAALTDPVTYYLDADGDGFGGATATTECSTTPPAGYVATSTDCDDASASIRPGAIELCDGVDQDCDGTADEGFPDSDGDGIADCVDTAITYSMSGGSIPDATNATPPVVTPLDRTFTVPAATVTAGIQDLSVTVTGLTHTWCGDVSISVITPGGITVPLVARAGFTGGTSQGDSSDFNGTYTFRDSAAASLWTAASAAGATTAIAGGNYFPSVSLTGARQELDSAINAGALAGTWTIRFTDSLNLDTGSFTGVSVEVLAVPDADGDGTADAVDGCPNDPNKTAAGACGCGVADTDSDGDGTPNCNDGCPNDPNKTNPGSCGCGVVDTDSDGDGTPNCDDGCPNDPNKTAPGACGCGVAETDSDGDGTPNCNDGCPSDPNKTAPGACGCGSADTDANGNGTADCNDTPPSVSFSVVGGGTSFGGAAPLTIRVPCTAPIIPANQVRLSLAFDPALVQVSEVRVPTGSPFSTVVTQQVDPVLGTIRFVASSGSPVVSSFNAVEVEFMVAPGAEACASGALLSFTSIGGLSSSLGSAAGQSTSISGKALTGLRIDGSGPEITGLPATQSISCDAGSIAGAVIAAPTLSATDGCDGDRAITLVIDLPDGTMLSSWPVGGLFPVGVTEITATGTDTLGNGTVVTREITVLDQQLLDLGISLGGSFAGASTRPIRITVGSDTQVIDVACVGPNGTADAVAIPASVDPPCIIVKDVAHSLAEAGTATLDGTRWSIDAALRQGDSNDDGRVDILDFAAFVAVRGTVVDASAASNFNADTSVTNADLAFISLHFFQVSETCGSLWSDPPLERVKVKDLRRAGLGHLAIGDLNGDGWVDQQDVVHYLQFGAPGPVVQDLERAVVTAPPG
ncbi:MAG: lamin tail domain-containing protein [Phycisphaerales bacterium]